MRPLAACLGLLLLGGCGDDSMTPNPDAPARPDAPMPDAATGPERGVVVVRHLGILDGGAADPNNFFDFGGANGTAPDNSLASLAILNTMIQNSICPNTGSCPAGGLRLLGQLNHYDSAIDDADVQVALYHAFDADTDPNNDFGGSGAFLIDPASLDQMMNPLSVLMTGHITGGTLYAQSSGTISLQLGPVTFKLVNGRLRGQVVQNGEATSITNGVLGGVLPACTAKQIAITSLNTTVLDLLTSRGCDMTDGGPANCLPNIEPDIDLNGGGLDTYDNDFGTVTACHHNGTTITGPDCACDPSLQGGDGFSVVQFFDALPARIVGTAPPDAGAF